MAHAGTHKSSLRGVLLGAASLMATSAIGPGFLTQTAVFSEQYRESFAFMIVVSLVISLAAQLNVWRIIGVSRLRGQEIAERIQPGLGFVLAGLVCLGGLAFNVGNVAGAGLGLNALCGLKVQTGAVLSALFAIVIFLHRDTGRLMDWLAKGLGAVMIVLTAYVTIMSRPPLGRAAVGAICPSSFSLFAVVTLVGGTVGGYITFSGAHRLLDAGVSGPEDVPRFSNSAASGILIVATMRLFVFLAFLGVVAGGFALDPGNPPASAFRAGAGEFGYRCFGLLLWCAAVTSIVGSAYTSVSFLRTFHPILARRQQGVIAAFVVLSTAVFLWLGRPVSLLILAGALNGLILPVTLGTMLAAVRRRDIVGDYRHPRWLLLTGCAAAVAACVAGYYSLQGMAELWN
jgi:Mn2+/Fe2+ NRAMP family transporter